MICNNQTKQKLIHIGSILLFIGKPLLLSLVISRYIKTHKKTWAYQKYNRHRQHLHMKTSHLLWATLFLFTVLSVSAKGEILDATVAIINDEIITRSELNQSTHNILENIKLQHSGQELDKALRAAEKDILNKLITKKIIEQEAKRRGLSVSDQEIQLALQRHLQQNKTNEQQLRKELKQAGLTEEQYLTDLHHQILISKLVSSDIRSKIVIPEEQIKQYYETNYTQTLAKDEYFILQIGCTWQPDSPEKSKKVALQRIEQIRMLAVSGKDFAKLAKKYSDLPSAKDGGNIGILKRSEIAPIMYEAISQLKPQDISSIIETSNTYQVLKLIASSKNQTVSIIPYETAHAQIHEILFKQKIDSAFEQWFQDLQKKSFIKILIDN
ncbi:MAG: SurA N-terminal domain-containing protein [Desulfobulbaceae bacterium]|nr:SurA N-terminal domain-containing protein [Desulfobulbaceae bacterium]